MKAVAPDIETLRTQARNEGVGALTALGKKLLVGDGAPLKADVGVDVLREAVSREDGEAAALLAVCAAWGVAQTRDIRVALDCLVRAAELRLDASAAGTATSGARLRAATGPRCAGNSTRRLDDVACSAHRRGSTARRRDREVHVAAECDWVIQRGRSGLARAKVYRGSADAARSRVAHQYRDVVHHIQR